MPEQATKALLYTQTRKRVERQLTNVFKTFGPLSREELAQMMDGAQDAVMEWLPPTTGAVETNEQENI